MELHEDGYVLTPHRMYLGHTAETIGSAAYAMSLIGGSLMARLGPLPAAVRRPRAHHVLPSPDAGDRRHSACTDLPRHGRLLAQCRDRRPEPGALATFNGPCESRIGAR